jgi:hypothetical protein
VQPKYRPQGVRDLPMPLQMVPLAFNGTNALHTTYAAWPAVRLDCCVLGKQLLHAAERKLIVDLDNRIRGLHSLALENCDARRNAMARQRSFDAGQAAARGEAPPDVTAAVNAMLDRYNGAKSGLRILQIDGGKVLKSICDRLAAVVDARLIEVENAEVKLRGEFGLPAANQPSELQCSLRRAIELLCTRAETGLGYGESPKDVLAELLGIVL